MTSEKVVSLLENQIADLRNQLEKTETQLQIATTEKTKLLDLLSGEKDEKRHSCHQPTKSPRNLRSGCSGLSVQDNDLLVFRLSDTLYKSSLGGTATNSTRCFCHPPTVAGGEIRLELEHLMKTIFLLSMLFCAIAMPLRAQTPENSEIKDDIATLKTDLAVLTTEVKNLKENVNKRFDGIDKRFDGIEKGFDRLNNIIIACIGIPLAILAIGATVWGILAHKRSGKDRVLERQIETLTQEIETLKQQRIVNP